MTNSDFDFVQPVESLHNVQGLTPAKEREERRRRQRASTEAREPSEPKKPDTAKPQDQGESHTIDYCA